MAIILTIAGLASVVLRWLVCIVLLGALCVVMAVVVVVVIGVALEWGVVDEDAEIIRKEHP